jgi:hypothetical protein
MLVRIVKLRRLSPVEQRHPSSADQTRFLNANRSRSAVGASRAVPTTKPKGPLWVQKADSRRDAREWAQRADSGRSPKWGAAKKFGR